MNTTSPVPECTIYTGKRGVKLSSSKAAITAIVRQLSVVFKKGKDDVNYTASIQQCLKGIASPTIIAKFKKVAVERKVFVEPLQGKIRFREGISEPNDKMVISLLEEMAIKSKSHTVVSSENHLLKFTDKDLADELRRRGWIITATKTTTIKL